MDSVCRPIAPHPEVAILQPAALAESRASAATPPEPVCAAPPKPRDRRMKCCSNNRGREHSGAYPKSDHYRCSRYRRTGPRRASLPKRPPAAPIPARTGVRPSGIEPAGSPGTCKSNGRRSPIRHVENRRGTRRAARRAGSRHTACCANPTAPSRGNATRVPRRAPRTDAVAGCARQSDC